MANVIGIDIGGTKITGIVFDGKKIVKELKIVTPKNKSDFIYSLKHLVNFLSTGINIKKIGIGVPGRVNPLKFTTSGGPNLSFLEGLKFSLLFSTMSLKIDNDAHCFTRCEMIMGAGKKMNSFAVLTLGTGIGGGIVINRQLYAGSHNAGGELGHMIIDIQKNLDMEQIYQSAKDNKNFKHDFETMTKALAIGCLSISHVLDPEAIIIGGGVMDNHAKDILKSLVGKIKKSAVNASVQPKIIQSKTKNAGALGAALMHLS